MPYHFLFLVFVILDLSFQFTLIFSFFSNMEAISLRVLCAKFVYRAYLHNLFHKMIKIWTVYVDCLKLRPRQPRSKQTLVAFWKVELTWAILHLLAKKKRHLSAVLMFNIFRFRRETFKKIRYKHFILQKMFTWNNKKNRRAEIIKHNYVWKLCKIVNNWIVAVFSSICKKLHTVHELQKSPTNS